MPIYKPSELRQFLTELGINPKKALSQNFLIDGNIIRKIIEAAQIQKDDLILEIGPGPGSLSEALLKAGAHLLAVEKDHLLASALKRLQTPQNHLDIFCEDIMKFPIEETLSPFLQEGQKAKVIANLPYHLTTPILSQLVVMNRTFSALYVMVQEEVARRFVAMPGTSEYSSFTLFLNFFTTAKYAFTVSKHCFFPEPSVQSAVVILELKEPPHVSNREKFFKATRTAFSHRRKMLRASLKELYDASKVTETLEKIQLNPLARPEELSLEQWILFFEKLNDSIP